MRGKDKVIRDSNMKAGPEYLDMRGNNERADHVFWIWETAIWCLQQGFYTQQGIF